MSTRTSIKGIWMLSRRWILIVLSFFAVGSGILVPGETIINAEVIEPHPLYQYPDPASDHSNKPHHFEADAYLDRARLTSLKYRELVPSLSNYSINEDYIIYLPIVHKPPGWTDCSESSYGTMLINIDVDTWITPDSVLIYANDQLGIKGMTGTGAPSERVRDEWFGRLPGWRRSFMRGTYESLTGIHQAATVFGMEDMYECYLYGPESAHQAGDEALDPLYWVPMAEDLAEAVGKCLIYAPAVRDYEYLATPEGEDKHQDELLESLIAQVAAHVDVWMVQLGKYQPWVDWGHDEDGNPYTMEDFTIWIAKWVSWIKTANPEAKVWAQLGIGLKDPIEGKCLPPQPPEYILEFREALIYAGVDGVWVMPIQPCQPCPPSPPPGFPCSDDPLDNEYYQQSLASFQQAIEISCGQELWED